MQLEKETSPSDVGARDAIRREAVYAAVLEDMKLKPRLFHNTKEGVTAILTPSDLEVAELVTRQYKWEHKRGMLHPAPRTYAFVTDKGAARIRSRVSRSIHHSKVAGSLYDLKQLIQLYNIEVIKNPEIFVPWVDTEHMDYRRQREFIRDCTGHDLYKELVVKQFPFAWFERLSLL